MKKYENVEFHSYWDEPYIEKINGLELKHKRDEIEIEYKTPIGRVRAKITQQLIKLISFPYRENGKSGWCVDVNNEKIRLS